jgi:hypothetical protein
MVVVVGVAAVAVAAATLWSCTKVSSFILSIYGSISALIAFNRGATVHGTDSGSNIGVIILTFQHCTHTRTRLTYNQSFGLDILHFTLFTLFTSYLYFF